MKSKRNKLSIEERIKSHLKLRLIHDDYEISENKIDTKITIILYRGIVKWERKKKKIKRKIREHLGTCSTTRQRILG